jgi:hypothetical protein
MQRNFWKTIKADGNDRCSDTDRGIAHHIAMFPWSRAHMPWQNRIKSDCDGPGQTDLTAMGVAAQKQIETSMCCLAVDFRGCSVSGLRVSASFQRITHGNPLN